MSKVTPTGNGSSVVFAAAKMAKGGAGAGLTPSGRPSAALAIKSDAAPQ